MSSPHPRPQTPDPNAASPRRVLLVRPSALGDVARTVPAAVSIKAKWPEARVEWVVNRAFADAVRHHRAVDEVILFDRDRPSAVWGLMRELRRRRYDVVYDLQGLARSGLLTWSTRAKRRVGFADAREMGWVGCNVRHEVGPADQTHTVDRMLGLLRADGVEPVEGLRLYVGAEDAAWAQRWCEEAGAKPQATAAGDDEPAAGETRAGYVVLAPTAQWGCKCWPVERFAALAEIVLREERAARVAVVCGPGERDAVREGFKEAMFEASRGFGGGDLWSKVLWPATSVGQLMAVIGGSQLVVCNDSAALHLAVGLGVPTVSLFGPTDPALVGPWGYGRAGGATATPGQARHVVLRAAGAADGARDYRRHKDDDTLMRTIALDPVSAAVKEAIQGATAGNA